MVFASLSVLLTAILQFQEQLPGHRKHSINAVEEINLGLPSHLLKASFCL